MFECQKYLPEEKQKFNFNVSHHGNWVGSVCHSSKIVGVDIMRYEWPKGCKDLQEYFELMKTSFASREWELIRAGENEEIQLKI